MNSGHHVRGVTIGIFGRLQLSLVEVPPIDECIMRIRLKYSLGFMSVVAVYASPEICESEEKMFYAKLESVPN